MCACVCECACVCACVRLNIHACTCVSMCMSYTYMSVHVHAHTYVCACVGYGVCCVPIYTFPITHILYLSLILLLLFLPQQVKQLKAILLSISDQRQELLRLNIQRVYLHLTWNNPPHPYDAFHSTLYLLWRKRNVFRTRSRDL